MLGGPLSNDRRLEALVDGSAFRSSSLVSTSGSVGNGARASRARASAYRRRIASTRSISRTGATMAVCPSSPRKSGIARATRLAPDDIRATQASETSRALSI